MNSKRVHLTPGIRLCKSNQSPYGKTEEQEVTEMLKISNSAGKVVSIKQVRWLVHTFTLRIKNRWESV